METSKLIRGQMTFPKKIVRNGSSDVITLPSEVKELLNIGHGDIVEVTIRKVTSGDVLYFGYDSSTIHWSNTPINALT